MIEELKNINLDVPNNDEEAERREVQERRQFDDDVITRSQHGTTDS